MTGVKAQTRGNIALNCHIGFMPNLANVGVIKPRTIEVLLLLDQLRFQPLAIVWLATKYSVCISTPTMWMPSILVCHNSDNDNPNM